jgi:hypothetical protein
MFQTIARANLDIVESCHQFTYRRRVCFAGAQEIVTGWILESPLQYPIMQPCT